MTTGLAFVVSWWMAAVAAQPPATKVPADLGREMAEAIIAANKALGLESWPAQGVEPCVDRGGEGTASKDVSAAETRRCAEKALGEDDFPNLGKGYALAIPMSSIGPITVLRWGWTRRPVSPRTPAIRAASVSPRRSSWGPSGASG